MNPMRGERLGKVWWGRGLVLATVLLSLATGFCLFDQDHKGTSGHMGQPDLCLGMLAVLLVMVLLVQPLAAGWVMNLAEARPRTVTLHIPDPPPKHSSVL